MLHAPELDQFGLHNPPAIVHVSEEEDLTGDQIRAAEREFDFERWARNTADGIDKMIQAAEKGGVPDLDRVIVNLEELEQELAQSRTQLQEVLSDVATIEETALRLPQGIRGTVLADTSRLKTRVTRLLQPVESVLRSYRDGRWNLMAVQAESEPSGDAPVFEDGDSLIAFLKA